MTNTQVMIALCRDGFHPDSEGGTVKLLGDGFPATGTTASIAISLTRRSAFLAMAEIQFAAGAGRCSPSMNASTVIALGRGQSRSRSFDLRPLSTHASAWRDGRLRHGGSQREGGRGQRLLPAPPD